MKAHEYDKASKYVGNISNAFIGEKNVINTNHVIINAILNTKYQEAISKNIVFVFKVNDLSKIVIEDEDLVVILANLLNNAIEACEKCEEKKTIKLKFVIEENLIVIYKIGYNIYGVYQGSGSQSGRSGSEAFPFLLITSSK